MKTKSPLSSARPLRIPGQSLDEELEKLLDDHAVGPYMLGTFFVVLAMLEWWRYWTDLKPSPIIFSFAALVAVAYAALKIARTRKKARTLRLGRDGERAVAQYLEWFRTSGYFVFHDVPTGDANIDHLLIGPNGIFTIETKTLSKPERGECKITVADGEVLANGVRLDRNPIIQAKAQAGWVKAFLKEHQLPAPVWPVVLIPGWYVQRFDMRTTGLWVLEPKALSAFLEREQECLARVEVQAIASAFSSHVRARMEEMR